MRELLGKAAELDPHSQEQLFAEVPPVITQSDNSMLEALPTKSEVYETLKASNLKASAGCDGIPGLLYSECWDILGDSIVDVIHDLFTTTPPSTSMRTALMIFSAKPKQLSSNKPEAKRGISILCTDFKLYEGLLARRCHKISAKILSPHQ